MNIKTFKGNNEEGKNILIISGVHGDEITPIFCTKLLQERLVKKTIVNVNSITIVSAVNKNGIKNNTRDITKKQSNDLNRLFTSDEQEDYVTILKNLIDGNDVIIDIHSSPNCTEFLLINQDFYANSYVEFCIKNDIKYFVTIVYQTVSTPYFEFKFGWFRL
jgi:predicted deacylase